MEFNLFRRLSRRRNERIAELEHKIMELEKVRDGQVDINTKLKAQAEEDRRKLKNEQTDRVRELQFTIEKLERKAQTIDDELAHLMKIRESKLDLEYQRKALDMEKSSCESVMRVKLEYQTKIEGHLNERIGDLGKMYAELLDRLPDINVALKGHIGN